MPRLTATPLASMAALLALAAAPSPTLAQQPHGDASIAGCTPAPHPYFEFQVDHPASFIAADSARPRPVAPSARTHRPTLLVQFLVDTAGTPDLRTFKTVVAPSRAAADSARDAAARWRFTPAMLGGCKVVQLVQLEVER